MTAPHERTWRLVAVASFLVQLAVLYWPRPPDVGGGVPGLDLLVHVVVFAAVALAARRGGLPVLPVALALLAHAVLSEVVQDRLLAERTGSVVDVVADVVGTGVGLALAPVGRRRARS